MYTNCEKVVRKVVSFTFVDIVVVIDVKSGKKLAGTTTFTFIIVFIPTNDPTTIILALADDGSGRPTPISKVYSCAMKSQGQRRYFQAIEVVWLHADSFGSLQIGFRLSTAQTFSYADPFNPRRQRFRPIRKILFQLSIKLKRSRVLPPMMPRTHLHLPPCLFPPAP